MPYFIRHLTCPVELDFMAVSSYGTGAVSSGKLKIKKDLDRDVKGRDVVIVEDIIDSGFTLANLKALLLERGAASVMIVTLLNKAERREYDIAPDYNCSISKTSSLSATVWTMTSTTVRFRT